MLNILSARFEGEPSLVAPGADARFDSCLQAVMRMPRVDDMLSEPLAAYATAGDGFWPTPDSWKAAYRPYVVSDGVLQIPVKGVLLNDFPWAIGSYATGYVYILRAAMRGMADPQVHGLALICDTPGGMVAGNFDLVDKLYAMRGAKPIRAFAHESAYSAGYSIASAADRIIVSRTGGVGSIGVVTGHVDRSTALAEAGLKVTFIFAGKHKVDGNATEPLAADVKARMQARIDRLYAVFVSTVARNRGMPEASVQATEALTYTAEEAVIEGLADAVGSLDDEIAAFSAGITSPAKDNTMITPKAHRDTAELQPPHATRAADTGAPALSGHGAPKAGALDAVIADLNACSRAAHGVSGIPAGTGATAQSGSSAPEVGADIWDAALADLNARFRAAHGVSGIPASTGATAQSGRSAPQVGADIWDEAVSDLNARSRGGRGVPDVTAEIR